MVQAVIPIARSEGVRCFIPKFQTIIDDCTDYMATKTGEQWHLPSPQSVPFWNEDEMGESKHSSWYLLWLHSAANLGSLLVVGHLCLWLESPLPFP